MNSKYSARRSGALVLAAGRSRRMGREKVLLPFGSATILETVLATLSSAEVAPRDTVVVLRAGLDAAAALAVRAGASSVVNPEADAEMMSSIRVGLSALPSALDAFFVWPADHPAVSGETIRRLLSAADPTAAVIPCWEGRRGHPALVGRELRSDAMRCPDTGGLRELWRSRADAVRELAVDDPGVVADADTPEAYEAALRIWTARNEPPPGV